MPSNKLFHILCTSGRAVIYEGRFQCRTSYEAMELLKKKVGRTSLQGLRFSITAFPIEIFREVVSSIMNNQAIPEGDLVRFTGEINPNHNSREKYSEIQCYKKIPTNLKPQDAGGIKRHLGKK